MTKKLFKLILAICLLFSSLYFPAHAETAGKAQRVNTAAQAKKSPEEIFLDGDACLGQGNLSCARLALANIPSTSAYAKLLSGSIALSEQQTDKALSLLLPLQTENTLIAPAKIKLHESLATVFEKLDDAQQAIQHLIEAEAILINAKEKSHQTSSAIHDRIWTMLEKIEQSELIALRGNNTDTVFQGWVDLRLAAINQDLNSSIKTWATLYPDHPAQMFAKNLAADSNQQPTLQISLASAGSIALIMPHTSEINATKAQAFRLGLEAALNRYGLPNTIQTYPSTENAQDWNAAYTLAKQEGNAYFIQPSFDANDAKNKIESTGVDSVLHVSPVFTDEVQHIADFARRQGIQNIAIITTENDTFKEMAVRFETAWRDHAGDDATVMLTLPADISFTDSRLLELKSRLAEKMHDMILLALPAEKARMVRPHLQISTPTMTFSEANEIFDDETFYSALNAVRLYDIPYLLFTDKAPYKDYEILDVGVNSYALLRWFALGVDSLQLLVAAQQMPDREVSISGLTGKLTLDNSGTVKRALPLARFTHSGIAAEQ